MTPALFDLPLRLGDAAALAGILLNQPSSALARPLDDEVRSRLAGRASALKFDRMTALISSLERDPVHPLAWFLCVDGVEDQPLLLRVAPASTPSSGLFPKAILIGRTFSEGREVVLSAIPFSASDGSAIVSFSTQVNRAFQPKPANTRPAILISTDAPARTLPVFFEAFRNVARTAPRPNVCLGCSAEQDPASFYYSAVWAAIRTGWREGYSLHSEAAVPVIEGVRGRPFSTEVDILRRVIVHAGTTVNQIAELLVAQ